MISSTISGGQPMSDQVVPGIPVPSFDKKEAVVWEKNKDILTFFQGGCMAGERTKGIVVLGNGTVGIRAQDGRVEGIGNRSGAT